MAGYLRKNVFCCSAPGFNPEGVGTKIDFTGPFKGSSLAGDAHLRKKFGLFPAAKYAIGWISCKVDRPLKAVIKPKAHHSVLKYVSFHNAFHARISSKEVGEDKLVLRLFFIHFSFVREFGRRGKRLQPCGSERNVAIGFRAFKECGFGHSVCSPSPFSVVSHVVSVSQVRSSVCRKII